MLRRAAAQAEDASSASSSTTTRSRPSGAGERRAAALAHERGRRGAFAAAAHVGARARSRAWSPPRSSRAACVAEPAGDLLTVWLSAQDSHRPLAQLGLALDRPRIVRIVVPEVGGGFGSKGVVGPEAAAAALAAIDWVAR